MRRKIFASIMALAAGATSVLGQGYQGSPYGAGGMPAGGEMMAPPGGMPMNMGGPPMGGPGGPPMGDPSGGLMGGAPVYPPPGYQGMSPYPDAGGGGGGGYVPHWWVNGEYLLMFIQSQPARQPFVTTSASTDAGALGQPTTQVIYSQNDKLGVGLFSGFRIMGGWYKDADRRCGFEFGGMLSENRTKIFTASSDPNGVPTLARPFNDANGGTSVFIVSNLGQAAGAIVVANTTRFYGAEGNFITNLYRSCPDTGCFWNVDSLLGFRFFQLREDLTFDSSSTIIGSGATFVGQSVTAGGVINVRDSFEAYNQFYGGQLGLRATANWGRCYLAFSGKCAFGLMHQSVDVAGATNLTDTALGINATASGGVLATRQNIGNYKNDEFAILPELGVNLGYNWCSWFSTYIGYNGLYVNRVVRVGDSLPVAVNTSLIPASGNYGAASTVPVPNTTLSQSDFWVQGVTFGFRCQW